MSRTIEFRAWDKEGKEYYYNAEHTYDFFCSGRGCYTESFGEVLDQPDRFIVEQYTGLKDKNGKEIYEGDIIKFSGGKFYKPDYYVVGWHEPFACFHLFHLDGRPSAMTVNYVIINGEAVGNIHEPPKDFRPEHLKRMGVSISKGSEE